MSIATRCVTLCLLSVAIVGSLSAQPVPEAAPVVSAGLKPVLDAAAAARARGDRAALLQHLERALWQAPFDVAVLEQWLLKDASDDDRTLLSHRLFAALSDARGTVKIPPSLRKSVPASDNLLKQVATARAAAVAELARVSESRARTVARTPADWLITRWTQTLAGRVMAPAPALWSEFGAKINAAAAAPREPWQPVIAALSRVVAEGRASGQWDAVLEASRALLGLAAQTRFPDLKGPPPPDLSLAAELAQEALAEARAARASGSAPLTAAELAAMSDEQRVRFTAQHTDWLDPAVAISEGGRYRVETTCGHGTLLAALQVVNACHERLVQWFGRDPFDQPGIVRIVPDAAGLELEGTPQWWAGGFQAGDITTVRFSAGTIGSLVGLLTHELTHRFDGRLYPGLPAWLLEGRAVWTEASYRTGPGEPFAADYADFSRLEATWLKGYGRLEELSKLLSGTQKDYRDNYPAGYALFLYLSTWEQDGGKPYLEALPRYLAAAATRGDDAVTRFARFFADGANGRPAGIAVFAERFERFLKDFYWMERGPISRRYGTLILRDSGDYVYDFPIWRFTRVRAEPWFGDEQAARAAEVLQRHGKPAEAAAAWLWSLQVDEWSQSRMTRLAEQLLATGQTEAAWVLRAELALRGGALPDVPSPLLRTLPKTQAFVDLLATAAEAYGKRGLTASAAACAADRARIGGWLGLAHPGGADASAGARDFPFDDPAHSALALGLREDELTDHDEYRVAGLFHVTDDARLVLGRAKPPEGTGPVDRAAYQQQVFVRGNEWFGPGRYRVTTRIHLDTAYVEGAIVIGYTRRDRNLRFRFTAGDLRASLGAGQEPEVEDVLCVLSGVRDAESSFSGQEAQRAFHFAGKRNAFDVELVVDGGLVVAYVNGEVVGSYHTPDDAAVEGYVGFATARGAFAADRPTVQDLGRRASIGVPAPFAAGLTLADGGPLTPSLLLGRRVAGLPLGAEGTIALWVPRPRPSKRAQLVKTTVDALLDLDGRLRAAGFGSRRVLVLPDDLTEAERAGIDEALQAAPSLVCEIVIHHKTEPLASLDDAVPLSLPMAIVVDPHGVLRALAPFAAGVAILPHVIDHWLRLYTRGGQSDGGG